MGKVVTFAALPYNEVASGVSKASVTGADATQMSAEVIRLAPGARFADAVPHGSDRYFFTLKGAATLSADNGSHEMAEDTFAAVQEATSFTLVNKANAEVELISVLALPPGNGAAGAAGFKDGITVIPRDKAPVVEVPDQKKTRLYLASKEAARTERSHAMIVKYQPETVTNLHMHPNADSMFVFLTGKVRFNVNGEDHVVERGQATYFPAGDKHSLKVASGDVSFLEFHIPGSYVTVK